MKHMLYLLHVGNSRRLERLLRDTLYTNDVKTLRLGNDMRNKRIIFAVSVDEYGMDRTVCDFLRFLRKNGDCLLGSVAGVIVDGSSELYTKQVAQELVLAANMAGYLPRQAVGGGDRFSLQPAYHGGASWLVMGENLSLPYP